MSSETESAATINDSQPMLTPKLRFPEFRDTPGWTPIPGNELFDQINNRQATPGLPILAITQEHGAIPRDAINYHVSVTDKSVETYKEVQRGDFIISLRSFQGGIEYSDYHGICSPAYVILRKKVELSDQFFKHLFKSHNFIQDLTKNLEGLRDGKMISYKQFSELQLPYPLPAEQEKVADCLNLADDLVATQAQKVDVLKAHKKGLMQQLFPREGETAPYRRFPEFQNAEDWEMKSIGHLGEVVTGSTPGTTRLEYYGGDKLFVSPGDISDSRFIDTTKTTLTPLGFEETRPIKANSILFVCIGSTIGKIAQNRQECATNQQINAVVPHSDNADGFVYYALSRMADKIANLAGIQAVPIVNKSLFSSIEVAVPKRSEQTRIANFLSSLDETIQAETQKLDALKTHKTGLMQQLLPSQEEV